MNNTSFKNTLEPLRKATLIWISLVLLTCLAGLLAETNELTPILIWIVLLSLIIKAQLITDNYMGLKRVKLGWRISMTGFSTIISALAWLLY